MNRLILGDNLEIMKTLENESVDLIYLDPPFFSNRNYEVIWGDAGEIRSFEDRWAGGISHYIEWLNERVALMYRLLKKTGSIFCTVIGMLTLIFGWKFSTKCSESQILSMNLHGKEVPIVRVFQKRQEETAIPFSFTPNRKDIPLIRYFWNCGWISNAVFSVRRFPFSCKSTITTSYATKMLLSSRKGLESIETFKIKVNGMIKKLST